MFIDIFLSNLQVIKEQSKSIGVNVSIESLAEQILLETNYCLLIPKQNSINTVRIMNLLAEAQSFAQNMKGKDIVFICGSTGSGKSTSTNYLMGIPLQKFVNNFGDEVVRIKVQKNSNDMKMSVIGQSIGTSQTIYSQGHQFINSAFKSKQLLELMINVLLCDNPGFHDTRGSDYQICTNLSVDRAIQLCKEVKAVVLVVPYQALILDKCNHLIQLLQLVQQRFPKILEVNSNASQNFYIIITKWSTDQQKERFKERISAHLTEQITALKRLGDSKSNANEYQYSYIQKRIRVFRLLKDMEEKNKIDFIQVTDKLNRNKILQKYLQNKRSIQKTEYVRAMQGEDMQKSFSDQISICTHTWTFLILNPYLKQIPKKINDLIRKSNDFQKNLDQNKLSKQKNLENLQKNMKLKQDLQNNQLVFAKQQYQRVLKGEQYFNGQQKNMLNTNESKDMNNVLNEKRKSIQNQYNISLNQHNKNLQILKDKVQIKKIKKKQFEEQKNSLTREIAKFNKEKASVQQQLASMRDGKCTDLIIINMQRSIGQQVGVGNGSYTAQQRLQYIEKGQTLPDTGTSFTFKAGEREQRLCYIFEISRKYVLLPNKEFDPNNYIKNSGTAYGKYKTNIQSRNVILQHVKLIQDGKKMALSYLQLFTIGTTQACLPLLRITHSIPNQQIYWSEIHNYEALMITTTSSLNTLSINLSTAQQNIKAQEQFITQFNQQIKTIQNNLRQIHQQIQNRIINEQYRTKQTDRKTKITNIQQTKKQAIQQKEHELERVIKEINSIQQNIKRTDKLITEILAKMQENKEITYQEQIVFKQFALLIKDQLKKNVPQSLQKFISIAFQMEDRVIQRSNGEGNLTKAAKLKIDNYNQFKDFYNQQKDSLEMRVMQHLSQDLKKE